MSMREKVDLDPKTKAVFDRKGYEVLDKISEGAFGKVFKARRTDDGTMSAVKVMDKSKMPKRFVEEFLPRELDMLQRIHHPNVLEVFDIFQSKGKLWIFMEFAPNGVLTKRCDKTPLTEDKAKKWFKQCADALNYMHRELKICHRDIKTDNILLDSDDNAKLSDFGFTKELEDENGMTSTVCGTLPYYSPEMFRSCYKRGAKYGGFQADCWAMGVMLFCMLTSKLPFVFDWRKKRNEQENKEIIKMQYNRVYKQNPRYTRLSEGARHLIDHLLDPNPETRYTTSKMVRHKWLLE